jgi:hypothetical protein
MRENKKFQGAIDRGEVGGVSIRRRGPGRDRKTAESTVRLGHSVNVGVVVISSSQVFQREMAPASAESFLSVARREETR